MANRWEPPTIVETALAFVVGAAWFAITTFLFAEPLPNDWYVALCVVAVDIVVILAVWHYWDIQYAVTVGVASVVALDWYFIPPIHRATFPDSRNALALVAYLVMAAFLGELAVRARRNAVTTEGARRELAGEQAALRRVATLVARETAPEQLFAAVTLEVGKLLDLDLTTMLRYESDGRATVVASIREGGEALPVGARLPLEGDNVAGAVLRTGEPARVDSFETAAGPLAADLRAMGVRSSVGCPIDVGGNTWGVMVATSMSATPIPGDTERRLSEFTELTATAVANAQSRAELAASRSRIVAAADQARKRIERDLHDGVQQRLVSLALGVRLAADPANDEAALRRTLPQIEEGLLAAVEELRELSQGIHPAILSEGGLRPALAGLARRSALPVDLSVTGPERFPAPIEVGGYYAVSEALTNATKHAQATALRVEVEADETRLSLVVTDDGVGGVDRAQVGGTGLIGLEDRVHALGGSISVTSPKGGGTTLRVTFPLTQPEGS